MPSAEETPEEIRSDEPVSPRLQRVARGVFRGLLITFVLFFAYPILFPVVIFAGYKFGINIADADAIHWLIAPLEWLVEECPPYSQFLEFLAQDVFRVY